MSLYELLHNCGAYDEVDDSPDSDMDVCVGDENPPAPAPAPASPVGSASTSALSATVPPYSLPQEDQAQGSGDNADHPVDVDLDCGHCSPHSSSRSSSQSLDVCDGDGARPLRLPADPAERPTPRTPTSSAGGARGEGGPAASDRSPTVSILLVVSRPVRASVRAYP